MADDHSSRPYRSSETIARSGQARSASSASGNDPLAELARLIGQTDPFGDIGKEPRSAPQPVEPPARPARSFAPHQPAPSVAPEAYTPQTAPNYAEPLRYDQAYGHAPAAEAYDEEPEVPAYLTQRAPVAGYDRHGYEPGADGEDVYDDLPPRRRVGVLALAGIFALAVIGTAGAFGYRAVFGGSGSHMPPPVIKADTAPSKIVPENSKDPSKLITERVNGAGEKMVSREETPVDIKDKIATPVFPPVTTTSGQTDQAGAAMAAAGNGVVAGSDPKKVHTIVIRPDQPVVADAGPAAVPTQSPPAAVMPAPQPAPPLAPARPQQQAAPAPEHETRPAQAMQRAPAPPPARAANAPLSLSPDSAPAPRAPSRVASTAPTSLEPAVSANPARASHGGYAVQVTSQRSEAEAQAAYRALQGKYGNVLGGRSMFVHKVELGGKGTYYRAMVGPFASQAQASQLCSSLKSAGGSCLIQRN